jgi:hypothetical protein
MRSPKVIALYRTDRGRFALDETGDWQPSIKATIVVGREEGAPVAFLCGLLNSELLDLWYAVRGKTPWHVRRNYEPLRMNEMPEVEVHIVPSTAAPGGMGELTTPAIAPAVGNAIYAATGKRIRRLPFSLEKLA